eukprot:gene1596-biopygen21364
MQGCPYRVLLFPGRGRGAARGRGATRAGRTRGARTGRGRCRTGDARPHPAGSPRGPLALSRGSPKCAVARGGAAAAPDSAGQREYSRESNTLGDSVPRKVPERRSPAEGLGRSPAARDHHLRLLHCTALHYTTLRTALHCTALLPCLAGWLRALLFAMLRVVLRAVLRAAHCTALLACSAGLLRALLRAVLRVVLRAVLRAVHPSWLAG